MRIDALKVKIFADGADKARMLELSRNPLIKGFTTNPTLMRQSGVKDYEGFARDVLEVITDRPISFEVFSDEFEDMRWQAKRIASWGPNVYVKVPVTNTRGESSAKLVSELSSEGVKVNVTAILTLRQVRQIIPCLAGGAPSYISIFAGRIADAGCDPLPILDTAVRESRPHSNIEIIWASPRELLNIVQADQLGCQVITVTHELLKKLSTIGRDLAEFSLDTVRMFYQDAAAAGFTLSRTITAGGEHVSNSTAAASAR